MITFIHFHPQVPSYSLCATAAPALIKRLRRFSQTVLYVCVRLMGMPYVPQLNVTFIKI
jgi:hypothetical protein